jgi:hypothetical protein
MYNTVQPTCIFSCLTLPTIRQPVLAGDPAVLGVDGENGLLIVLLWKQQGIDGGEALLRHNGGSRALRGPSHVDQAAPGEVE